VLCTRDESSNVFGHDTESGREAVSVHVGDEVAVISFTAIGKLMGTIQTISLSPKNVNRAELRPLVKMSAS
jgi:hypothetical protein